MSQLHRTPPPCYPWEWGIYPWLEGENPSIDGVTDDDSLTGDLERFVDALRRVDLPGGPPSRRGAPLAVQHEEARSALAELVSMIDTDAATAAWEDALQVTWMVGPAGLGPRRPIAGEPAAPSWPTYRRHRLECTRCRRSRLRHDRRLGPAARDSFRATLGVDDATWARGCGWALSIGLIAQPFYKETTPVWQQPHTI